MKEDRVLLSPWKELGLPPGDWLALLQRCRGLSKSKITDAHWGVLAACSDGLSSLAPRPAVLDHLVAEINTDLLMRLSRNNWSTNQKRAVRAFIHGCLYHNINLTEEVALDVTNAVANIFFSGDGSADQDAVRSWVALWRSYAEKQGGATLFHGFLHVLLAGELDSVALAENLNRELRLAPVALALYYAATINEFVHSHELKKLTSIDLVTPFKNLAGAATIPESTKEWFACFKQLPVWSEAAWEDPPPLQRQSTADEACHTWANAMADTLTLVHTPKEQVQLPPDVTTTD